MGCSLDQLCISVRLSALKFPSLGGPLCSKNSSGLTRTSKGGSFRSMAFGFSCFYNASRGCAPARNGTAKSSLANSCMTVEMPHEHSWGSARFHPNPSKITGSR